MGSKNRIAKDICPIIQNYIDNNNISNYVEPFVGGANVIDKIFAKYKFGSDLNRYLIALLKRVRDNKPLYDEVSKDLYSAARNDFNNNLGEFSDWELGNIGFLASYNGRFFDGGYAKSRYEKTKTGQRYRDYYREAKSNLLKQAPALANITFECMDYKKSVKNMTTKSVVYCDIPYVGTTQFSNSQNFDYEDFWNWARELAKEHIVLISEQTAPSDFDCIWERQVSRSINSKNKSRATEKLFVKKWDN